MEDSCFVFFKKNPQLKGRKSKMGVVRVFLFYFDIFCLVQDRERAATSACHCNQPDAETGLFLFVRLSIFSSFHSFYPPPFSLSSSVSDR